MTKVFENKEFWDFYDPFLPFLPGRTFSDLEFRHCRFVSSGISTTRNPRRRSTIRNVKVIQCTVVNLNIHTAIVEGVLVDGLETPNGFHTWGAVFKHVTLRGKIGSIMLNPAVSLGLAKPHEQQAFDEANAAYYSTVDWALDISEAEFWEADIRRVPAHLIRRDPLTQVVVKREKALEGKWRQIDLSKTYWPTSLQLFLERGDPDVVLVAPKRDPHYQQFLDGLKMLREVGVAEPD